MNGYRTCAVCEFPDCHGSGWNGGGDILAGLKWFNTGKGPWGKKGTRGCWKGYLVIGGIGMCIIMKTVPWMCEMTELVFCRSLSTRHMALLFTIKNSTLRKSMHFGSGLPCINLVVMYFKILWYWASADGKSMKNLLHMYGSSFSIVCLSAGLYPFTRRLQYLSSPPPLISSGASVWMRWLFKWSSASE